VWWGSSRIDEGITTSKGGTATGLAGGKIEMGRGRKKISRAKGRGTLEIGFHPIRLKGRTNQWSLGTVKDRRTRRVSMENC